jgi:hypothetical protein
VSRRVARAKVYVRAWGLTPVLGVITAICVLLLPAMGLIASIVGIGSFILIIGVLIAAGMDIFGGYDPHTTELAPLWVSSWWVPWYVGATALVIAVNTIVFGIPLALNNWLQDDKARIAKRKQRLAILDTNPDLRLPPKRPRVKATPLPADSRPVVTRAPWLPKWALRSLVIMRAWGIAPLIDVIALLGKTFSWLFMAILWLLGVAASVWGMAVLISALDALTDDGDFNAPYTGSPEFIGQLALPWWLVSGLGLLLVAAVCVATPLLCIVWIALEDQRTIKRHERLSVLDNNPELYGTPSARARMATARRIAMLPKPVDLTKDAAVPEEASSGPAQE